MNELSQTFEGTFKKVGEFKSWLTLQPVEYQFWISARLSLKLLPQASIRKDISEMQFLAELRATMIFGAIAYFFRDESKLLEVFDQVEQCQSFAKQHDLAPRTSAMQLDPQDHYLHNPDRNAALMGAFAPLMIYVDHGEDGFWKLDLETDQDLLDRLYLQTLKNEYEFPLQDLPIWDSPPRFTLWKKAHNSLLTKFRKNNLAYDFWERWYKAHFIGNPLDWDLQFRVLSLPNSDWSEGTIHIAEKIREIEAEILAEKSQLAETLEYDPETDKVHVRHIPFQGPAHIDALLDNVEDGSISKRRAVLKATAELETEAFRSSNNRFGMGGNQPPSPIDDGIEVAPEVRTLLKESQSLKRQATSETIDRAEIEASISSLEIVLREGLKWFGRKIDLTVDTAIKWAVPCGGGWIVMNPDKISKLIEAAKALLQ